MWSLRPALLDLGRQHGLDELALERALPLGVDVLHELLRDRRAALRSPRQQVDGGRAREADRVDRPVLVEALVLDRDDRLLHDLRDLVGLDELAVLVRRAQDREHGVPVSGVDHAVCGRARPGTRRGSARPARSPWRSRRTPRRSRARTRGARTRPVAASDGAGAAPPSVAGDEKRKGGGAPDVDRRLNSAGGPGGRSAGQGRKASLADASRGSSVTMPAPLVVLALAALRRAWADRPPLSGHS